MKMRVETSTPASVEQIFASHIDRGVREQACRESGALSYDVVIEPRPDGGARVQVDRVMAPQVPDFILKFVGESIAIRQIEEWSPPGPTGTRTATVNLTIKGQPASMVGSAVLAPSPEGSTEVVAGDVKVSIPLLGRKIEPEIVKVIEAAVRVEQRVGQAWARQNG